MASEQTPLQKHSYAPLILCLLAVVYLGYQLHEERQRTAPAPQRPLPTFESRIEPLRESATDWTGGYYFHVGKQHQPPVAQAAIWHPQQMPMQRAQQIPQMHVQPQGVMPPRQRHSEPLGDEILDAIRRDNEAWNEYMRHHRRRQQELERPSPELQELW